MHTPTFPKRSRKGAAFVEYVVLMGILAVAVIFAVVQLGSGISDAFTQSDDAVRERVVIAEPGGTTDPGGDPDGDPNLPVFPPISGPTTGVVFSYASDAYLSYFDERFNDYFSLSVYSTPITVVYDPAEYPTPPEAPDDWADQVVWTDLERTAEGDTPYNELVFTETGFSHNVGPLGGWGPGPEDYQTCFDNHPGAGPQYRLTGRLNNGDQVWLFINLPPEYCAENFYASRSVGITHSSGGVYSYGSVANAELAAAGTPNPYDWNDATWVVDYWDGNPDNGLTYSGLDLGVTGYQWNVLAGPAWYYSSDPMGEDTTCHETPFSTYGTVIGTHPSGAILTLELDFYPIGGDGEDGDGGDCFESFGP